MAIQFYEYAKCSTCVKARKWLEAKGISFEIIPIVEHPPSLSELKTYMAQSGLEPKKFFNTSGVVYREEKISEKLPSMSHEDMARLLASNGKLIKRPLLIDGTRVLVGFDEATYRAHFR